MAARAAHAYRDGRALVIEQDIRPSGIVYRNLDVDGLYQAAVQSGQAETIANGALLQRTAPFFGRAAKSSFYVNDPNTRFDGKTLDELIDWGSPEDGKFDNLQELIYVESHLSQTGTKFYGELTQQMLKLSDAPGSDNGTGFFQTLTALKLREIYEKITSKTTAAVEV